MIKLTILLAILLGYCPDKPIDMTCFEQAMHSHVEAAYKRQYFEINAGEPQGDFGNCTDPEDFSDWCVGCVDDCLEPAQKEK